MSDNARLNDELVARGVELSKETLYALAKLVPGGAKQALRPGAIPSWWFPDDAVDRITPELIEQAMRERLELDRMEIENRRAELERRRGGAGAGGPGVIMAPQIGKVMRELRERRGWSQPELAKRARVSQAYVAMLERGAKKNPSLEVLRRLAKALRVPVTELLG